MKTKQPEAIPRFDKGSKMKILIVISLIMPFISAFTDFKNGTILSCPRESILQLDSARDVDCIVATNVSKIEMNLTKIRDNCGPDSTSSYTLTIMNNPENKILKIEFKNITWMTGGDYMLAVKIENVTEQQKIEIKVADIPAIPAKLNFTNLLDFGSNLFAVKATLPRKHKQCEHELETSYSANYKLFGCISVETKLVSGILNCFVVNDTDNVDKDLVCVASVEGQTLDICLMKYIKDCRLTINLQGVNKLGSSSHFGVKTPRLKYTVPPMKPNRLKCTASSTKLKISWSKPCYYLDYEYRIKYGKVNQTMQRTSWTTSPYLLTGLTPYTNYQICIEAFNNDNHATKCILRRTSEDVPSKGPAILKTNIIDEGKENPRWDLAIFWKVPERRYWNGKPYLMIEHKETKTPEKPVKTSKLNIQATNFTLKGLFKDREYLIRIWICTVKGCNHSSWKNVEFLGAKKSQDIVLYVVIPISVVVLVIFCGVCAVLWRKRKELKYGKIKDGQARGDGPTVAPRGNMAEYEVPSIPSTQYEQPPPFHVRDEDLASTESEPEHRLDAGKLQFGGDFGTESVEETELERV